MNRHQGLEWPKIQARLEAHPAKLSSLNAGVHPAGNAIDIAAAMGIEVFTEEQYRELQQLGDFDTKTKSWVKTPAEIRKLGGALF